MKIKFSALILATVFLMLIFCGCGDFPDYRVTYSYRSEITYISSNELSTKAEIVLFTDRQMAGKNVTLAIKAKPQTEYRIEVEYSGGVSSSKDLVAKKTDANGYAAWIWKISYRTKPGSYPVRIYCGNALISTLQLNVESN